MNFELIKRMCTDFNDALALKMLYYSLVWFKFEYASLIWHTDGILQNQCLISIQNNFLRYLCYKCGIQRTPHSRHDDLNRNFKIILKNRFRLLDITFLFKLLHS